MKTVEGINPTEPLHAENHIKISFPSFYRSTKNGNFIVEFSDYTKGKIVYNAEHHLNSVSKYYRGYYSSTWILCTNRKEWIPLTPLETKTLKEILKKEILKKEI